MKALDIMTREVVTISSDATVAEAVQKMLDSHVSGLPVLSPKAHLIGMITEGDLLRRAELATEKRRIRWLHALLSPEVLAADYAREHGRKVTEVMTGLVETITEETPFDEIVTTMEQHHIKRLPVVKDHRVVGIVSRADLLQALRSRLSGTDVTVNTTDRAIRRRIGRSFHEMLWLRRRPQLSVRDGVVDFFWISPISDQERAAAKVAAENIPGVKEVRHNFVHSA